MWRGVSHGVHFWVPRLPCPRQGVSFPSSVRLCTSRSRCLPAAANRPRVTESSTKSRRAVLARNAPSALKTSLIRSPLRNIPSHPSHHLFRWPRPASPPETPTLGLYLSCPSWPFVRLPLLGIVHSIRIQLPVWSVCVAQLSTARVVSNPT